MIRRPPRSTQSRSSAASDVYKRQVRRAADEEALRAADEEKRTREEDERQRETGDSPDHGCHADSNKQRADLRGRVISGFVWSRCAGLRESAQAWRGRPGRTTPRQLSKNALAGQAGGSASSENARKLLILRGTFHWAFSSSIVCARIAHIRGDCLTVEGQLFHRFPRPTGSWRHI